MLSTFFHTKYGFKNGPQASGLLTTCDAVNAVTLQGTHKGACDKPQKNMDWQTKDENKQD